MTELVVTPGASIGSFRLGATAEEFETALRTAGATELRQLRNFRDELEVEWVAGGVVGLVRDGVISEVTLTARKKIRLKLFGVTIDSTDAVQVLERVRPELGDPDESHFEYPAYCNFPAHGLLLGRESRSGAPNKRFKYVSVFVPAA